jgi:hypothetical protein
MIGHKVLDRWAEIYESRAQGVGGVSLVAITNCHANGRPAYGRTENVIALPIIEERHIDEASVIAVISGMSPLPGDYRTRIATSYHLRVIAAERCADCRPADRWTQYVISAPVIET